MYLSLFTVAFLAATLLPAQSEILVVTAQQTFAGSGVSEGLPQEPISAGDADGIGMVAALVKVGFAKSNGEARRLIRGGGARLNDVAISDEEHQLGSADFIDGRAKISAGKKRHALLVVS